MSDDSSKKITVELEPGQTLRLDKYLAENLNLMTRSQLKLRLQGLRVNGKEAKISLMVKQGDEVELTLIKEVPTDLVAESMELNIIHEDKDVLVINKEPGIVVHPGAGNWSGTLVHGLLHHVQELQEFEGDDELRPGIVHRLDKETSGVMIVAKHEEAHGFLANQFAQRQTAKAYLALVQGNCPSPTWIQGGFMHRDPRNRQKFIVDPGLGKPAETQFFVLGSHGTYHLILALPKTGRTHQIRVHLSYKNLPILGDSAYGRVDPRGGIPRCMLHAWQLGVRIPSSPQDVVFCAPPPQDFLDVLGKLGLGPWSVMENKAKTLIGPLFNSKG